MTGYMIRDKAKFKEITLFHENRKQKLIDTIAHEKTEIQYLSTYIAPLWLFRALSLEIYR